MKYFLKRHFYRFYSIIILFQLIRLFILLTKNFFVIRNKFMSIKRDTEL